MIVVTLGLFGLVINGAMLLVTDWLVDSVDIDGLLPAIVAAAIYAVLVVGLEFVVARDR